MRVASLLQLAVGLNTGLLAQAGVVPRSDARPNGLVVAVPFELHSSHVYVRVQADDVHSGWFILDTGASTTLDSTFAASIGQVSVATERGTGGGDRAVTVRFIDKVGLILTNPQGELTQARVPPQRIAVVSLDAISKAEGRTVDGILGGSFFARFTVVIDYAGLVVSVYQTRGFVPPRDWTVIPVQREEDLIFARGSITLRLGERPVRGWYEIDTGGSHALILNAPFVKRHALTSAGVNTPSAMLSIGGSATAKKGNVASFEFAKAKRANVSTMFVQGSSGLFASDEFDGSVGGALLVPLSVIAFDYAGKRMWVGGSRR